MKKVIIIFGAILFTSIILTSCGGNDNKNSSTSNENVLQNSIYLMANYDNGYYFYSNDSCLYIYGVIQNGIFRNESKPLNYKISGSVLTISDSIKYRILNNQAILSELTFIDGEGRTPLLKSNDFSPLHK
jgi:hypothetical protein